MINYQVDMHIETGDCGMGMPVIRSWQAIKKLPLGGILQLTSSHPWAVPDMEAWCRSTGQKLLNINEDGKTRHFFVQKMK